MKKIINSEQLITLNKIGIFVKNQNNQYNIGDLIEWFYNYPLIINIERSLGGWVVSIYNRELKKIIAIFNKELLNALVELVIEMKNKE